ncbi:MAG: hypothetical protein K5852_05370 [Eubacterium sp.]|nr:hypothetical protein [Eubacterium sp.]
MKDLSGPLYRYADQCTGNLQFLTDKLLARAKKNMDLEQVLLASGKDVLSTGKKAMHLPVLASDALTVLTKGADKIESGDDRLRRIGQQGSYARLPLKNGSLLLCLGKGK